MFRALISTCLFLCFFLSQHYFIDAKIPFIKNNLSIKNIPIKFEYPYTPLDDTKKTGKQFWIVYSDREQNIVYSDAFKTKEIKKITFLDSFYVINISGDMFQLIHFSNKIIFNKNKIVNTEQIDYVGWVPSSNLLLNEKSFLDKKNKESFKYITILHGTDLFTGFLNGTDGKSITAYKDLNQKKQTTNAFILFNEIVYVYKQQENFLLIGKKNTFSTTSAFTTIIGWVDFRFVQLWGTQLFIEPNQIYTGDTLHSLIFPAKNLAIHFEENILTGIPFKTVSCSTKNYFHNKIPVLEIEDYIKDNTKFSIIKTGIAVKPFDYQNAFVYNANGDKITYNNLCSLINKGLNTNIVFVLNLDNDTKEYFPELIKTIDALDLFFENRTHESNRYHVINCNDRNGNNILSRNNYTDIATTLISLTKENMQLKKAASSYGMLNGLTTAANQLKNNIGENNIIIVISSQGDDAFNEPDYKIKNDKLAADLALTNSRVIFFQPYSSNTYSYSSFVPQAKTLLKKYSEQCIFSKAQYSLTTTDAPVSNTFRSIENGKTNTYCLDYPKNSATEGFILFPTIGSRANFESLTLAMDSLFTQINCESLSIIKSVDDAFNSSNVFNSKTNPYFERYYNMFTPLPRNLELACKNINFNYFINGYTICPNDPHSNINYYTQNLLLSEVEYLKLEKTLKELSIDTFLKDPSNANRKKVQQAFSSTFNNSCKISTHRYKSPNLLDFLYETCGYKTNSSILKNTLIDHLFDTKKMSSDSSYTVFEAINKKLQILYSIKNNPQYSFISNGIVYYWVNESMLP